MSSDSELSDSSLNSFYRSRKSSPTRLAPPPANSKHLRVPGTGKGPESSPAQAAHHPKKTANKAPAGHRSPAVPGRKEEKAPSTPSTITNVGSATQKPKRLHNTSKLKPALTMKVRKVQAIERDEARNVKLPVTVGIITIMNLGHVVYDRDAFHNERYIWPVGYKMSRSYNSMIDPHQQTTYTCSVIDDGEAPKFQIDAEDQPGKPIIAGTATGAWTHIVKAANLIRKRDHSNSASGPDYFGFSNATIAKMIQDLPNADKCKSYIMQRFEEPSAKASTAPEKRKISTLGSKAGKGEGDEGQEGAEEEEEGEGEDDDAYASLGTPGKKKVKRSSSPKIRQAGFDIGPKDGGDVEMGDAEQEEENELDELAEEDEETQSEKDSEDVPPPSGVDLHGAGGAEDQAHSITTSTAAAAPTGPPIVITSADKTVSREATSESEMVEIEDADTDVDVSAEAAPMTRTTTSTTPETTTTQNA
ncbi:F/Y-rich N-terminus-domain-containing protein [Dissophora ornata]|nr:F/Y-rich N-terminus-domain-containing protein [Dissophora ornata]